MDNLKNGNVKTNGSPLGRISTRRNFPRGETFFCIFLKVDSHLVQNVARARLFSFVFGALERNQEEIYSILTIQLSRARHFAPSRNSRN